MIKNKAAFKKYEDNNVDPYGKCCVDVARRAIEILDTQKGDYDPHEIICQASRELKAGISGFMAGCISQMVIECHDKGEDFRKKWNLDCQINKEGEEANKTGGILNPALININA